MKQLFNVGDQVTLSLTNAVEEMRGLTGRVTKVLPPGSELGLQNEFYYKILLDKPCVQKYSGAGEYTHTNIGRGQSELECGKQDKTAESLFDIARVLREVIQALPENIVSSYRQQRMSKTLSNIISSLDY